MPRRLRQANPQLIHTLGTTPGNGTVHNMVSPWQVTTLEANGHWDIAAPLMRPIPDGREFAQVAAKQRGEIRFRCRYSWCRSRSMTGLAA